MGPAIAFRPPEPTSGNSVEMAYGYQIKAGLTGGNSVNPVLFFDKDINTHIKDVEFHLFDWDTALNAILGVHQGGTFSPIMDSMTAQFYEKSFMHAV